MASLDKIRSPATFNEWIPYLRNNSAIRQHWEDVDVDPDDYVANFGEGSSAEADGVISNFCRQAARYYVAAVIVIGLFGNAGCLICYQRSEELKKYRSTGYLMALALSDLTFLLSLLLVWLKSIGVHWHDAPVVCQTNVYASNASIFLSAWYVMVLTTEMAFALRRPYSAYAAAADAGKSVLMKILIVTVLGLAVNSWTLALTKTGTVTVYLDGAVQDLEVSDTAPDEGVWAGNFNSEFPSGGETRSESHPGVGLGSEFGYGMDNSGSDSDYESGHELNRASDSGLNSSLGHNSSNYVSVLDLNRFATNNEAPFTYEAGCHISSDKQLLHITFVFFDLTVTYSIPFAVTLLLNCYIGYKLIEAGRRRRWMSHRGLVDRPRTNTIVSHLSLNGDRSSVQSVRPRESLRLKRRVGQQLDHCPFTPMELSRFSNCQSIKKFVNRRSTLSCKKEAAVSSLLIAKSIAYLIFNTPSVTHRIWSMWKRQSDAGAGSQTEVSNRQQAGDAHETWVQLIIYMLFFTQFSVNFLLYSFHAYSRRKRRRRTAKVVVKRCDNALCF